MDDSNREAYSVREFCSRFGIGKTTFYAEVQGDRLRAFKVGRKTLVLKRDAAAWAANLQPVRAGEQVA